VYEKLFQAKPVTRFSYAPSLVLVLPDFAPCRHCHPVIKNFFFPAELAAFCENPPIKRAAFIMELFLSD
jgi:hypothetical protein